VERLSNGLLDVHRVPSDLLYQSLSWEQIEKDSFEEEEAYATESNQQPRQQQQQQRRRSVDATDQKE